MAQVFLRDPQKHKKSLLKKEFMIPAVVYGPSFPSTPVYLNREKALTLVSSKTQSGIVELTSEEKKLNGLKVICKNFHLPSINPYPTHLDLYAFDMNKDIRISVQISYENEAAGVKEGGVLNILTRDIEVHCLPKDIPELISVDIANLQLHDSLHASDLKLPENVKVINETITLVSVTEPKETTVVTQVPAEPVEGEEASAAKVAEGEVDKAAAPEKKAEKKD